MGVTFYDGGSFIPIGKPKEVRMTAVEVLINGVRYVPEKAEQERQERKELQVGDFVKVVRIAAKEGELLGKYGKVIARKPDYLLPFLVEFSEPISFAHSGYGKTRDGHGWWFDARELEAVN